MNTTPQTLRRARPAWTRLTAFGAGVLLAIPSTFAVDLIEDFDGTTLNETIWERIGDKTVTVAGGRLTWGADGGNWADGEISPWQKFFLPPPGQTTSISWTLGPASITVDRGATQSSVRYQIGIYSANNTATRREHWANSTGGVWLDITEISSGNPGGVGGGLYFANDTKLSDSQGTWLAGVAVTDWSWQTANRTFRLELTDTEYRWYDGDTLLGTQTWADAGIDTEFGNGYRVMALGMNFDSGRGTTSIERVAILNAGEPSQLIQAFGPSRGNVTSGQELRLAWQIAPDASASLDHGVGSVDHLTTDGVGSVPVIAPEVTEPSFVSYRLTVTRGASQETRETRITVQPRPRLTYDDFVENFDGDALDPGIWQTRGGKTFTVANGRVNWNNDGGNWDHNEVDSLLTFPLPPPGNTTTIIWTLGPGQITTDIGGSSIRYQIGIFSYYETAGWSRQHWQNTTGGIWLDITDISNARPDAVSGGVLWADDTKPGDSQNPWLSGFNANWNWQTETHEFRLVLTAFGFTWFEGENEIYSGTWSAVNIDNEFSNGFRIMAAGMNYDTGRGFTSLERIEVRNGGVPGFFNIVGLVPAANGMTVTWESRPGETATYTVRRQGDLAGDWTALAEGLASQGETTSFTDTAAPAARAFYQVIKFPPPPLLKAGFEPGENLAGWVEVIENGQSQWEAGIPTSGPGSAYSGVHVYATKLAGDYDNFQIVGLRTPLVDLRNVPGAILQFHHYHDFEIEGDQAYDYGQVNLLDANGQNLLLEPLLTVVGASGGWRRQTLVLPNEAIGKQIRIEFKLFTDAFGTRPGWYLDDVLIE